jgi:type III secretion protein D
MDQFIPEEPTEPLLGPPPASPAQAPAGLVLRVLRGRHAGAAIEAGGREALLVGSALTCDVVLGDQGVAPQHLSISLATPMTVRALAEGVSIFGRQLAVGDAVALAACAAVRIGESAIALGPREAAAWNAVGEADDTPRADAPTSAEAAPPATDPTADRPSAAATAPARRVRRRWPLVLAGTGAAFVLLVAAGIVAMVRSLGTMDSAYAAAPPIAHATGRGPAAAADRPGAAAPPKRSGAPDIASVIRDLRLDDVRADIAPDGTEALVGTVPDDATLAELGRTLGSMGLHPTLRVASGERLVQDVREVFRVNGIRVTARYEGRGVVHVDGVPGDDTRMEGIRGYALHDVAGLADLRVDPAPPPAPVAHDEARSAATADPPAATPEEAAAKRIAAVVDGSPSYVATADGSRYFVGALMPQGYRITAIEGSQVTVRTAKGESLTLDY